jgi:hypothetical protein
VEEQVWEAANSGVKALQSLFMVSKKSNYVDRIGYFVVTGVARFARTSLFSGANNFEDLTSDPLLSAAMGFSEVEIRATFGPEVERLGRDGMHVTEKRIPASSACVERLFSKAGQQVSALRTTLKPGRVRKLTLCCRILALS